MEILQEMKAQMTKQLFFYLNVLTYTRFFVFFVFFFTYTNYYSSLG